MLLASACSGSGGVPGARTTVASTTQAATTTTTTEALPVLCEQTAYLPAPTEEEVRSISAGDPAAAALGFAADVFSCAAGVVVVSPAGLEQVALAARLAAAVEGPLLFGGPTASSALEAELARLLPQRVWLVGDGLGVPEVPEGTEVERLPGDPAALAGAVAEVIGGAPALTLPGGEGAETVAVAVRAMAEGAVLEPSPTTTTTSTTAPAATTSTGAPTTSTTAPIDEGAPEPEPVPAVVAGTGEQGVAWLVDAGAPALALAAAAAAFSSGALMALVDGEDLRRLPEVGRALQAVPGGVPVVRLVGEITPDASWQLPLLQAGDELPGGGYLLFPRHRLVALYGHSWAPELGVLAEQSPEEAVARIGPIAAQYAEEGLVVVPAFEIIATVADSRAGSDGNYSNETPLDDIRPWIEAAGEAGLYVLLDLQPGRSDFLSQARLYEEFLRLPYVGLALDPEWRLGPDQLPLQQFGSVRAAEVNEVAEWLAELVRREHLPQKMLLLHQFRLSMVPDREALAIPGELALVIQMDGQGALVDKYATWDAVTAGTESSGWSWGWKNFYDEDSPMATPAQVLALEPAVVYVSYQ
jgi:hypothetical protein